MVRFTPRKAVSTWSAVNIARVAELSAQGRMRPAGTAAFEARRADRSGRHRPTGGRRWVVSAKQQTTRDRRLAQLVAESVRGVAWPT